MAQQKKKSTKKQHFVPQFFQRFFSYKNNGKTIGMFNRQLDSFKSQVSIASQLTNDYFYGSDGELESWLSELETDAAPVFREMWEKEKLPVFKSRDHFKMLHFLVILDLRNPLRFKVLNKLEQKLRTTKSKISEGNFSPEMAARFQQVQTDEGKLHSLKTAEQLVPDLLGLKYKLIKNTTSSPFIISDNPLILYNQFLEKRKWKFGTQRDFGLKGIQFFLPLNDCYLLAVYDADIYKFGHRKELVVAIDDKNSIDQLNLLQFLNSETTVNFSHRASEHYIKTLQEKSKKYKKANDDFINVRKIKTPQAFDNFTAQSIEIGVSDLNIKLSLQKLNFISKVAAVRLQTVSDQYRKGVKFKCNIYQVYTITPIQENLNNTLNENSEISS